MTLAAAAEPTAVDPAVDPASTAVDPEPMALATSLSATPLAATTASTTESFTAASAAAIATESTPYLPFDMPIGETDKLVFAHYVPWLPVSVDNLPAEQDYYTTQYLNPYGEGGVHAAYGGYLRDRPLPRDPINDPNWRFLDLVTEINQAKSVGIDGFAVDIVEPTSQYATIVNLLNAAQSTGDFQIQVTPDMSGPLNTYTSQQFAAAFAPLLTAPASQRLDDGRVVLGAFAAEAKPASWWGDTFTVLHDDYDVDVAFVPTFLNAYAYMDSFAPISYGFSSWGGRNIVTTDPDSTFPGLSTYLTQHAHELGKIWMAPVAFQDNRPRSGVYEESNNTLSNSQSWEGAIDDNAEWVQLITWNDYAEMTAMAPSVEHGYRMLDMQAYNIAQFKYGIDPTVVRDALYVSHRDQFAASESTYPETMPMQLAPGTPAPVDIVDVVVFATAPATVIANIGGVIYSCDVGAGRTRCSFPLHTGDVIVGLERDGVMQTMVQSPYTVTNTPEVQDLQYHIAGGLR
jgi:Glycosyl hydrolase family 71